VRHFFLASVFLGCVSLAIAQDVQPPAPEQLSLDIREAIVRVPVTVKDAFNKEITGDVLVTTFRPQGAGPFPLLVMNHGRKSDTRAQDPRQRFESIARFFIRKGFAVAVPQRLGYGASASAGDPEDSMSCSQPRYQPAGDAAAAQVLAVVVHMRKDADIDASRLVIMGQSLGGFTTVATAATKPNGLIAAINVAGGHGGNPETRPGDPCQAYLLENTFGAWGKTATAPMLWLYTENDKYFSPKNSRAWFDAYTKAGAKAEYKLMPAFGDDGHAMLGRANDLWQPVVDEFLVRHGFTTPGAMTKPQVTGAGKAVDVAAVPMISVKQREDIYQKYLAIKSPKAIALGSGGRVGYGSGDDAMSNALGFCQRRTGQPCKLYAVDNDVVWVP
jgi:dienelactone hydrolase